VERSDGNDDDLYPPAPLPAHERQWRHPSEMGARAWAASEPPVAIGRGLTFSAGAIGSLLVLAVLFTMLPTHAGRSAVISVRSTIATGTVPNSAVSFGPPPVTAPTTDEPSTEPPTTLAVHHAPVPTYAVPAPDSPEPGEPAPAAVAVAVGVGGLVLTIAPTTEGHLVELQAPDGSVETAEVLAIDPATGLAVLSHALPADEAFEVAPPAQAGDVLSFYGSPDVSGVVEPDGAVTLTVADGAPEPELREGTPVVNEQGQLVALCAHRAEGTVLVPLDDIEALRATAAAKAVERVWLGIMLPAEQRDTPVIEALEPEGPASVAGLMPGDELVSVDGNDLPDHLALGIVLAGHQPGDTVRVVVRRDGVLTQFQVELGEPRPRL
jgi:S1-C subfamily serine protease